MRPHIDISHGVHGYVKDYAEAKDITISEAYEEILQAGFDALGVQSG